METKQLSKRLQDARLLSAIAGLAISVYLAYASIFNLPVACPNGQLVNCDRVLGSAYSKTFGIPNALFGVGFFLAAIALHLLKKPLPLVLLSTASMGFVAYFLYAEYQVGSICIWCTGAHLCALAVFLITLREMG